MAKALTSAITTQISDQRIGRTHIFKINSVVYTTSLKTWTLSTNKDFGSSSAIFTLHNSTGAFGDGGATEIKVGDIIEFSEYFTGDPTEFERFYGKVEQRSIGKLSNARTITLTCLDYISSLKGVDIDLEVEGTKIEVTNENLVPNYLPDPNSMFSQLFDFANTSIAIDPAPILMIRDKVHLTEEPQYDGFDVYYDSGQVRFGAPLNARDNHNVVARSYFFYTQGAYAEDVLESILTQVDGYGKYLFGESSAQAVIDNHLKTTYQNEDGAGVRDTLRPNILSKTVTIRSTITNAISANTTSIVVNSVDGLPASGSGTINGDTFTWSGITAHSKTLTGIPASGTNALKAHPANAVMKYTETYPAGQIWYLTYSNVVDTLTSSDFTFPDGNFSYFDKRGDRNGAFVILDKAISLVASVKCDYNYTFKTIQATGIELNKISFRSREVKNRFEAIEKLREYLAPNYVVRTQGDNKIWSSYLFQKTTADYTLNLVKNINYLEDDDLYSRVKFYGKNKAPINIMYADDVDFATTGQSFKAFATQNILTFDKTENGKHIFKSVISDAGYIVGDFFTPKVYINGVPIDNQLHQMIMQPLAVEATTRTETTTESSKWGGTDVTVRNYFYYKIQFGHQNIEPNQQIICYNPTGTPVFTIAPNDGNMDYGRGIYNVPGDQENATMETLSTATYWVRYATNALEIDYDSVKFRIAQSILPNPTEAVIRADYEYYTVFTPQRGVGAIIDGRWDTQVQTEFFAEPPSGFPYAILDLGTERNIQAIDLIAGFYKPDNVRKFDVEMRLTLLYSTDNVTYRQISDETQNFGMNSGEGQSFEEEQLGGTLTARYIKINLEGVKKLEFGNGVWPVAFTEVSIYEDIVLETTASLIPTAILTAGVDSSDTTILVGDTSYFTDPDSGSVETAYLGTTGTSFTYTGLTSARFLGCSVDSGANFSVGDKVYQDLETDTTLYDNDLLLNELGDKLYKDNRVSDEVLYTQTQLDNLSKAWLEEFYKEHNKISLNVVYAPYLKLGQTISLTDSYNNVSGVKYFIQQISESSGSYNITLAQFP